MLIRDLRLIEDFFHLTVAGKLKSLEGLQAERHMDLAVLLDILRVNALVLRLFRIVAKTLHVVDVNIELSLFLLLLAFILFLL